MKLNEIRDNEGATKNRMRVGRGIGSGKGKTGGRGVKGQKARTGVAIKGFEGGQMPLHRRLPKRGFNKPIAARPATRSISAASSRRSTPASSTQGAPVTVEALVAAGVVSKPRDGVKILGVGELKAKLAFEVAGASKSAVEAIEKAGGSVTILRRRCARRDGLILHRAMIASGGPRLSRRGRRFA